MTDPIRPGENPDELLVFDHGFVRLDACMADDMSVVNSARVSFAVRKDEMDDRDKGLIRFLMRERHGTPTEHNAFRFHIRTPMFVAREWFRHRIGCLTGDTEVTFVNINGEAAYKKTMQELFGMWHGEDGAVGRKRVKEMRLRVLDEVSNQFTEGRIADVFDKGIQPVYRLSLVDGKVIEATENHRFFTSEGWSTLREAVCLQGSGANAHPTREAHLVVNGMPVLVEEISRGAQRKECRLAGHPVKVVDVEYVGVRQTYDLSVEGPWHNFVANGIVVHNSFNEESARYHKMADDFYVPDVPAVRSQVGKPGAYTFEPVDEALALETQDVLRTQYKEAYATYQDLVERGVAKEVARSVLPVGIYTQFYWTINARALMNFLSLRNSEFAQYEIRVYAQAVERFFAEKMPLTYECFVEFGRKAP